MGKTRVVFEDAASEEPLKLGLEIRKPTDTVRHVVATVSGQSYTLVSIHTDGMVVLHQDRATRLVEVLEGGPVVLKTY